MTTDAAWSRRDLIATVTGGALLGGLWGAAFPIVATERRPSIAIIGHRNAQVILIDSTSARVLILSGEPDDELLNVLPAIMTLFRQRIDILIATPTVLAQRALGLRQRWRVQHALALSGGVTTSHLAMASTDVDDALDVSLQHDLLLGIRMGHRNAWKSGTQGIGPTLWRVSLQTPAGIVTIAPDVASVAVTGPPPSTLMIAPDAPSPEILAVSPASALAVNFDSDSIHTAPTSGPALTRIYPRDVARIVIGKDGLELPEWTVVLDSEDTR